MATKFIPAPGRVLIAEFEVEKIAEGVFIPDSAKDDMLAGIVVATGRTVDWLKEQDKVLFGPHAGIPIRLNGIPFKTMKEGEIIGRLDSSDEE